MSIASSLEDRGSTERAVEFVVEREFLGGEIVLDCFDGLDTRVVGLEVTGGDSSALGGHHPGAPDDRSVDP